MNLVAKIIVIVAVIAVAVAVVVFKDNETPSAPADPPDASTQDSVSTPLPRLMEFGRGKCEACKALVPVLNELREQYGDKLEVVQIDIGEDPIAVQVFGIQIIPTLIFFDASGGELNRHEGFMSTDDILGKFAEYGIVLRDETAQVETTQQRGFMRRMFGTLARAVEGSAVVAVAASFAWGILSILLSPCHLTSIPLIVGFIDKQGRTTTGRAFVVSTLFSVGILITIGLIGAITAAAGRLMGDIGAYGNYVVAVIFFLVGLVLLDVLPAPWSGPGQIGMKRKGMLAAFVLGLVFGIALGPCTFAFMAPMLGVTFRLAAASLAYGILLLVAYGVGHCSVIVLAGTCTELVQRYLNWNERSKGAVIVKRVCGVLVLLGGLYLMYTA